MVSTLAGDGAGRSSTRNMNPGLTLGCSVDITGLSLGVGMAEEYSKRTLPQICNTSAFWITVNTKNDMPFVAPGKMDSELAALVQPVNLIGKRGRPIKKKRLMASGISATQRNKDVALAILIVMARHRVGSNYNELTHYRYQLPAFPQGMSRAEFQNQVAEEVHKMIARRHSSGKFLLAGFIQGIETLRPFTVQKFMRGVRTAGDRGALHSGVTLGSAAPAKPGLDVMALVVNGVGLEGDNKESFNDALNRIGAPILQRNVNAEGIRQMEFAAKEMEKELAAGISRYWGP